jgi:intracellular sulfur oxidation DsrE/DsrF family protein
MQRAEQLHIKARIEGQEIDPVAFVLHGPEVRTLLSPNYENNKPLVDLAARLTAFEYIELKVCRRWMGGEEIDPALLPPFIGTVPWGAAEMERLMQDEGYIYF